MTSWSEYNAALRRRGFLLVWLGREMSRPAPKQGQPGWAEIFLDAAIQFCFSIKVLFGLARRRTIGMVESLPKMAGLEDWPVPDYSTLYRWQSLCRRQKTVTIQAPCRRSGDPLDLLVDTTVVKMGGAVEWQVRRLKAFGERVASRDPDR